MRQGDGLLSMNDADDKSKVADRLRDLNLKATQLLVFLSFALVAAILLETSQTSVLTACQKVAVKWSLRLWVFSLFPVLLIVLPIQEIIERNPARWIKVVLLWFAVLLIISGAIALLCAIW
jgi:hypothetical protein